MQRTRFIHLAAPAAAFLLPLLAFEVLRRHPAWDPMYIAPAGHFYIVSITSLLAAFISFAIGFSAKQLRNLKLVFLAQAFLSMGGIFAVHGLSTPGFLMAMSHVPGIAAQLCILISSMWLWLSSLPTGSRLLERIEARISWWLPVWFVTLIAGIVLSLTHPEFVDWIPLNENPLKPAATALVFLFNGLVVYRYLRGFRYARLPLQMAIVYSACWLSVAQWIINTGTLWNASWWLYHFVLLAALIGMIAGYFRHAAAGVPLRGMLKALFTADPKERIEACISPSVKSLVVATESRDLYTAGHNFRVAMYALRLGEELKLEPEQLRALAQGAVVHDVGKIQIPDAILNKPGRLTPEERMEIEAHPAVGFEMCRRVGFMKEELEVIRHHHERWDGAGYPDRLAGESIPLLARITAVADVYDALTSTRSYRVAWTHEMAMEHLLSASGTQFDPACVEAWSRLCSRDPDAYRVPSEHQQTAVLM